MGDHDDDQQEQQLKAYEREIIRARSRLEVADLDSRIDKLIEKLVGKLTKSQHKQYQASRLNHLMSANPDVIITRRAILLGLTIQQMKHLTAPDVMTMEELTELVVIMQEIEAWLIACENAGETSISFRELVNVAKEQSRIALDRFRERYQRDPQIQDIPPTLMRIVRAEKIKKLVDKSTITLPSPEEPKS